MPSKLSSNIGILGIFDFIALFAAGHSLFKSGHKAHSAKRIAHSGKKKNFFLNLPGQQSLDPPIPPSQGGRRSRGDMGMVSLFYS